MLRILHAADLHLDSPFYALPEDKAALRRVEQRRCLAAIARLTETENADILLLAGDIFDNGSPWKETSEQLYEALSAIKIPVFIAPGNHDFFSPASPYARLNLPENVHVFKDNSIQCVELPELGARVWGAGFTDSICPGLLSNFEAEKDEAFLDIMCIHGEVGNKNSAYNPITIDELSRSGMDYVALGHIHSFPGLLRAGETFYTWPGCSLGRGFDETGEKGIVLAEIQTGHCQLRFIPLEDRRYEILKVDLTGEENHISAISRALPEACSKDIYRIVLCGECASVPDINAVYSALESRVFALQLRDSTILKKDIWQDAGSDTLKGLFLARLQTQYDQAENDKEKSRVTRAVRWGLAALDGREKPYADR